MKHNKQAFTPIGHAESLCLSISASYQKQRDHQTLRAARLLRMRACVGFTLVELLVVVLIIGILSAIAIPMYQGAVDKSHWSTMLPGAKALKDAQEAVRMSNGLYTSNMDNLDVRMPSGDVQYTLETVNDDGTANVVRATSTKLPSVRLSNYLDENTFFAGQLHCEVKDRDERATRLCEKLLGGQELNTEGGYTRYLLDQSIDQATCDNVGRVWSNKNTKCFKTEKDRCTANGMPYENGQCGWTNATTQVTIEEGGKCTGNGNTCNNATINEGGICEGNYSQACRNSTINNGGVCIATGLGHHGACADSTVNDGGVCIATTWDGCAGVTVNEGGTCWAKGGATEYTSWNFMCKESTYNGGKCIADAGPNSCSYSAYNNKSVCEANVSGACSSITINDGAKCIANKSNTCTGTYNGTGCCEGQYCPSSAPKC